MENSFDYLQKNIIEIRERIARAAKSSGRRPEEITLVAVSKTFEAGLISKAFTLGVEEFGENYIQEAVGKIDLLNIGARWHFLGHLQKNKVKPAVLRFDVIQSVDSPQLLSRIDRIAGEEKRFIEVLLQVNLTGEESKSGLSPEMLEPTLLEAAGLRNMRVVGLMLIPPFYDKPEKNRRNFASLREMVERIDRLNFPNWEKKYLSMGMTDDFEIAIEEGSNMVRIGRAIFGQRRRK